MSLADCVALATAAAARAIATADPPLAAAARAEGIDVIALPDSEGRAPYQRRSIMDVMCTYAAISAASRPGLCPQERHQPGRVARSLLETGR